MNALARAALARAALAGAATGARSFTGLAALTLAAPPGSAAQPDRSLGRTWVKALVTLAAAEELVLDKLPQAPSRLDPVGLGARVATGAAVGAVAARREPERLAGVTPGTRAASGGTADAEPPAASPPAPSLAAMTAAMAVAVGATVGAAWLGAAWRKAAARRFGRDYVGAGVEDLLAMSLAWTATRV